MNRLLFQYKSIRCDEDEESIIDILNKEGKYGWELVNIEYRTSPNYDENPRIQTTSRYAVLYLKRKTNGEEAQH